MQVAQDCERFGAEGITVHPRPDERHIRYQDVFDLKKIVTTELNIEGNPTEKKFIELVLANKPTQVTLVPDAQNAVTSNAGWDTKKHKDLLSELVQMFRGAGIRTSIFVDADPEMVEGAASHWCPYAVLYVHHDLFQQSVRPRANERRDYSAVDLPERDCGALRGLG